MSYYRLNKDMYYISIANAVSQRSTCLKRMFGAVLVKNDHIISTGYNGSPRGHINCCDAGICLRKNAKPGEGYEACKAVHAEMNAIINAARAGVSIEGATMYIFGCNTDSKEVIESDKPCTLCARIIQNSGLEKVIGLNNNGEVSVWDFYKTYGKEQQN